MDDDDDGGDGGGGGCGWTRSAPRSSCCTGLSVRTLVFGGSHCLVETRQTSQRSRTPPPPATAGLVKARFCNKNTLRLLSWNLLNFYKRNIFQKVEYFTELFTYVHYVLCQYHLLKFVLNKDNIKQFEPVCRVGASLGHRMLVAMIEVTQTSFVLPVIEVKTSLVPLPSHRPVVSRKLLTDVAASNLYILIVRHEVTEPAGVPTLHQPRATAGLEALENLS